MKPTASSWRWIEAAYARLRGRLVRLAGCSTSLGPPDVLLATTAEAVDELKEALKNAK